jgi:hypothetical protein
MTPAVAGHVRDALRKLLRNYERPGSPSEDIIATIDEINDQLRAAERQEAGGR